jgi:hypothetical protein
MLKFVGGSRAGIKPRVQTWTEQWYPSARDTVNRHNFPTSRVREQVKESRAGLKLRVQAWIKRRYSSAVNQQLLESRTDQDLVAMGPFNKDQITAFLGKRYQQTKLLDNLNFWTFSWDLGFKDISLSGTPSSNRWTKSKFEPGTNLPPDPTIGLLSILGSGQSGMPGFMRAWLEQIQSYKGTDNDVPQVWEPDRIWCRRAEVEISIFGSERHIPQFEFWHGDHA